MNTTVQKGVKSDPFQATAGHNLHKHWRGNGITRARLPNN